LPQLEGDMARTRHYPGSHMQIQQIDIAPSKSILATSGIKMENSKNHLQVTLSIDYCSTHYW